jgi:hypothetical protein
MLEELKAMNEELANLQKEHLEKSKAMFTNIASKIFDAHPKLESFGWRQYTPYFNDGDECTFSAHTDEPDINGINGYDVNFEDELITVYGAEKVNGQYPKKNNEFFNPDLAAAHKDVHSFLNEIEDSVFRQMFGDHVRVTVKRAGTEVEDYEHD